MKVTSYNGEKGSKELRHWGHSLTGCSPFFGIDCLLSSSLHLSGSRRQLCQSIQDSLQIWSGGSSKFTHPFTSSRTPIMHVQVSSNHICMFARIWRPIFHMQNLNLQSLWPCCARHDVFEYGGLELVFELLAVSDEPRWSGMTRDLVLKAW